MRTLILISACSFLACLVMTPLIRNLFLAFNIVDEPMAPRKTHTGRTPRIGGIPIALSYLIGYAVLLALPVKEKALLEHHLPLVWKLLPAAGLVFLTGLVDDFFTLKPWQKLCGQSGAAVLAVMAGVRVVNLEGQVLSDWCSIPLTVVWLLACTNAFNLIDGIDGLASGAGLFATMTILIAALLTNNTALALATFPLVGCLCAFLIYNFNPASIFLGDCGSLLIGFLLGCYGIVWSQKSVTMLGMTAPLMAMALPLLDAALSIGRRYLRKQPLFTGDRGHIHHKLLDRGLTPRRAALFLYGMCGIAAAFSLMASITRHEYLGVVVILFCAAAWMGIQNLGYDEFGTATAMVRAGMFRTVLNAHLEMRTFETEVARCSTLECCWDVLIDASRKLGYDALNACLNGRRFDARFSEISSQNCWSARVDLPHGDYVQLISRLESRKEPMLVGLFCATISISLGRTLLELVEHPGLSPSLEATTSLLHLMTVTSSEGPRSAHYAYGERENATQDIPVH